jgi:hypothetical protein
MSLVFASSTCSVRHAGNTIRLEAGQCWAADDPFVLARPELFTATPSIVFRTASKGVAVEQATKAPGERRTIKRG